MSKCCCKRRTCGCNYGYRDGCGKGCCNFPSLIVLILILLQFSNKCSISGSACCSGKCSTNCGIDKGIIFIITLFYLSCCSPCGRRY